jgi:t-SNARE complex subunit (syntaxin)
MDNQLSMPNLENEIATSDSLIVTPQSQTVAKKMAEIARLKQLENKAQTAIKVVIGGAVLSYASRNSNFAKALVEILDKTVTRDNDLKRINATLDNLRKKAGLSSQSTQTTNEAQPQPIQPNYHQG